MLYLLLTLSLTSLGIFTFLPQCQGLLRRYDIGINFFLTLVATLIGVLLAIAVTNYDARQQEKQDLIKLLRATAAVVDTSHRYGEELLEYYNELAVDDPLKAGFFTANPPPYPEYLDTLMLQQLVSKNLSQSMLTDLNGQVINLKKVRQHHVPAYLSLLNETMEMLALEIRFQQGELSEREFELQLEQLGERQQSVSFKGLRVM